MIAGLIMASKAANGLPGFACVICCICSMVSGWRSSAEASWGTPISTIAAATTGQPAGVNTRNAIWNTRPMSSGSTSAIGPRRDRSHNQMPKVINGPARTSKTPTMTMMSCP